MKIYKIKNNFRDIEPHEVFLDKLVKNEQVEAGLSEKKFEVPLKEKISYILFFIFFILSIIMFSKIFYLQIFEGKKLYIIAENNKGGINLILPDRGIIYDKNMKKLVLNYPIYDLVCDRAYFSFSSDENLKEIEYISNVFNLDSEDIINKIKIADSSDVLVASNIDHEKFLLLESKKNNFLGCKIKQNITRKYVFNTIFSQVLGYMGRINKEEYSNSIGYTINDYIGKTGLEQKYETYLRGKPGKLELKKSYEKKQPNEEVIYKAEPGDNLVLNIDSDLQTQIYNSLEKSIKNVGAKKGAAVAMDPKTGAVLALVSYPSYDNNLFSKGISQEEYNKLINDSSQPFFNRAIAAKYPTGSIIKPFEALGALQEKIISPDKEINDIGYILVKSQHDPDVVYKYGGVKPHGWVDMRKAIAVSSNIYFYTIGGGYEGQEGLGPARIKKYLSYFGWDQKTGVDLPGEFSGFIPSPEWKKTIKKESWFDGDTYNLSIGQSDLQTTPLQVATAYCAIANGGILYKPQIVNKIISSNSSEVIKEFQPEIIRKDFIDPENLEIVKEGMRDGVSKPYGSSSILNSLPVSVAAKTGTAEIGYENQFNLWSSVFAPYEDPQIVVVVTVEKVRGFGAVTLPVARDVLQWYFENKKTK